MLAVGAADADFSFPFGHPKLGSAGGARKIGEPAFPKDPPLFPAQALSQGPASLKEFFIFQGPPSDVRGEHPIKA